MKKIIILCLFIIIGTLSFALNFTIYPTKFEVDLSKSSTQEMYIVNNTDSPLRVGIAPESDKKFGENYNLNSNIKVFPKVVSVKPAGKQIVRFRVIPDKNLKDEEKNEWKKIMEAEGIDMSKLIIPMAVNARQSNKKISRGVYVTNNKNSYR